LTNAWNWLFRDRRTGRIVIMQWPNIPLWIFIAARVANAVSAHTAFRVVGTAALFVWAVLEVARGVNPFRRGLGAVVLVAQLAALIVSR
jgi:hypothetical protein